MTSKILFFNLMKEDMKKKIWIIVVAFLGFLFVNPIHMLMQLEGMYSNTNMTSEAIRNQISYYMSPSYFGNGVLPAILAVVLGIAGFTYLFSKRKVDLYHSIPVKREKLFAVSYLNGIVIYFIVYVVSLLMSIITLAMQGYLSVDMWKTIGITFIGEGIHFLCFYHLTIIAVMLTGNLLVCVAATVTLLFYGPAVCQIADRYFSKYFLTYYANYEFGNAWLIMPFVSPVSSLIYFTSTYENELANINLGLNLFVEFFISIILLVVAIILYKKRPSEIAGKAMSYKITEPIVRILVVIPIALAGGMYLQTMSTGLSGIWFWFGFLFGGIICHAVIEVIYKFDFKAIFNHKLQLVGSLVIAAVISICFQYDWLGYDKYIPEENEIISAAVVFQSIDRDMSGYEVKTLFDGTETLNYSDKEVNMLKNMKIKDTSTVCTLAKAGIEQLNYERESSIISRTALLPFASSRINTSQLNEDNEEKNTFIIRYRLKNGKEVTRYYATTIKSTIDAMSSIYKSKEYKEQAYSLMKIKDTDIISRIDSYNVWNDKVSSIKDKSMNELLDIYLEELGQLTIKTLTEESPILRLNFIYQADGYEDYVNGYYIYPSFTKTINKLKEIGVSEEEMDNTLQADNIDTIRVYDYGYLSTKDEIYKDSNSEILYQAQKSSSDSQKIEQICDNISISNFLWSNSILRPTENSIEFEVKYLSKDGFQRSGYAYAWKDKIPEFVIDDLKENADNSKIE